MKTEQTKTELQAVLDEFQRELDEIATDRKQELTAITTVEKQRRIEELRASLNADTTPDEH